MKTKEMKITESILSKNNDDKINIHLDSLNKSSVVLEGELFTFPLMAYTAKSRDCEVLNNSSSGGLFYEISRHVLAKNGIIYAACANGVNAPYHKRVDDIKDIKDLMGSKYVQSELGRCLMDVKLDLESGKIVAFFVTPCQVMA